MTTHKLQPRAVLAIGGWFYRAHSLRACWKTRSHVEKRLYGEDFAIYVREDLAKGGSYAWLGACSGVIDNSGRTMRERLGEVTDAEPGDLVELCGETFRITETKGAHRDHRYGLEAV